MFRHLLTAAMLAASSITYSQSPQTNVAKIDVEELCILVAENLSETDLSRGTRFRYQSRLFAAAGAGPQADTRETISAKMQKWWSANQSKLICNVTNSIVRNGSILKLSVDSSNSEFINDAVRRWKVDLNHIDADGTTVLDFVDEERKKADGTPRFATLNRYYNIFAGGGAKHARELR